MKCSICEAESKGELCEEHAEAEARIRDHYTTWHERMDVTWEEYLRLLEANESSGKWIREVASYLIYSGARTRSP
ncbi:MAG: hypothetical protein QFX35_00390 [Candidatus Verstraetearchaeota archaeon]|nr:hypothetical protein [Candidatus Verstraetearchaeota archaeon]